MRWETVPLGDVVELCYGRALKAESRSGSGYPVVGSGGIVGQHDSALVDGPTVVVGRKGSIGSLTFVPDGCWPIDTAYYTRLKRDVDVRWLYWTMHSLGLNAMNKSAAVPGLNRDDAHRCLVPLPPLPEQRRVAAILDEADALRGATKRMVELLTNDLVSSIAQSIEHLGVPSWRPLADFIDPERPLTYGILKPGPDVEDGVQYVRVADMDGTGIRVDQVRRTTPAISHQYRRSVLKEGDLLMSIRGHVGRLAIIPPELEGANITQDSARIAASEVDPRFLATYIRSDPAQRWMARHTKGVAVRGINLGDLRNLPVPDVSRAEQTWIAAQVTTLEAVREDNRRRLGHVEALFASLQHRAFLGEL